MPEETINNKTNEVSKDYNSEFMLPCGNFINNIIVKKF